MSTGDTARTSARLVSVLPNVISCSRMLLVVPFVWFFGADFEGHFLVALVTMALAIASDLLDGYTARKLDAVSETGSILDLIADRLVAVAAVMVLAVAGVADLYLCIAVIAREAVADTIRLLAMRSGRLLAHNWLGRAKFVAIIVATSIALLGLHGTLSLATTKVLSNSALSAAVIFGVAGLFRLRREMRAPAHSINPAT